MVKGKVLIIDEDRSFGQNVQSELHRAGYEVVLAYNGREGVSAAKREKPQLILLDIVMPGLDGFETLMLLRQDPETAGAPVVILTNYLTQENTRKAKELGAVDFWIKALHGPNELAQAVTKIFDERHKATAE